MPSLLYFSVLGGKLPACLTFGRKTSGEGIRWKNEEQGCREEFVLKPIRFLQFGDVHIGTAFRGSGFTKQTADIRSHDLLVTFRKACETALELKVDFLVIAGDLFEGSFISSGQVQEILVMCKELAPMPIFITPGNHDPYTIDSPYRQEEWGDHVHIFGPQVERVELADGSAGIWGYGYPSTMQRENPFASLQLQASDTVEIVIIHGSVDAPEGSPYLPISRSNIRTMGADYTVLAHYHTKEIVWEEAGRVRAAYAGSLEPLGFDELGEHGAFLAEVEKGGARLTWIPLAKRTYCLQEIDVTDCGTAREISNRVREVIHEDAWANDLHRICLTGTLDSGIELEVLAREWADLGFCVQVQNHTHLDYDLNAFAPDSIHGKYIRILQEKIALETDEEQKVILEMALAAGLDALTYGRVIYR